MKKNILITTLSIVIILLLSYIVYDKYIANKNNIKDNQEIIQEKNEIITETDKVEITIIMIKQKIIMIIKQKITI